MKIEEANKLINKMQKDLEKSGIVKEKLVKDLKALRPYALEEEDPTLTKVIRLTYEHLEEHGDFNILVPEDDAILDEEGEEIVVKKKAAKKGVDEKKESLAYLLLLMLDRENKVNRQDLIDYRDLLMEYSA